MNMKQIMKFNGTMPRTEWWIAQIAMVFWTMVAPVLGANSDAFIVIWLISLLPLMWFSVAINKARLNEAGWSGWWQLMPIVNLVVPGFFGPEEESDVVGQT